MERICVEKYFKSTIDLVNLYPLKPAFPSQFQALRSLKHPYGTAPRRHLCQVGNNNQIRWHGGVAHTLVWHFQANLAG